MRLRSVTTALLLTLAGAGLTAHAARVVVIPEAQFKLKLPTGWELVRKGKSSSGKSYVASVSSKDRQLRVRVRATPKGGADLQGALKKWEQRVLEMRSVRWERIQSSETTVDGRKQLIALYFTEMLRNKSTQIYRAMVSVIASKRGTLYLVAGFIEDAAWDKRHKELSAVVESFDLLSKDGTANVKIDPKAPDAKPFAGKTKEVTDPSGGWKLDVPEDFLVSNFGKDVDAKGVAKRHTARMHSPKKNVRVFVNVKKHEGKTYDFGAHFKRFAERIVKKGHYRSLAEIKALAGKAGEDDGEVHWRGYSAYGIRNTSTHAWRVLSAAIHSKRFQKIYTLTVAIEKDALKTHGGVFMALLSSFAPYGPEVVQKQQAEEAKQQAAAQKTPAKAGK